MALKLTFLGHSGFVFDNGKRKLVVDPFLSGNPLAVHGPEEVACDVIALTHGHGDHLGDTVSIAQRNDATVIAPYEVCDYLGEQGLTRLEPSNPGGRIETDFGYVAFTPADHSASFEGRYMGVACGLVISMGDKTVYHAGDTGLFGDMKLIGELARPDLSILPVGGRFTMTPEIATYAAELVAAPMTVPCHYKTFPIIGQNIEGFMPRNIEVIELNPGESWTLA